MTDLFDVKFELLKVEMDTLQNAIRTYDSNLFTIKGWAITIFSAFIIFAAQAKQPFYLTFCAVSVILFWFVDGTFKTIQKIYIRRYNEIERFLQSSDFSNSVAERSFGSFSVPNIQSGFRVKIKDYWPEVFRSAINFPTSILYIVMILMTIAFALAMIF